jgi:uncharacterized protein (TIGR00369 family)
VDTKREKLVRESFARQGLMTTIGAKITSIAAGQLEIHFPFSPALTQQNGFIHAGAVASVMDSACGYAAMTVAPDNHNVLSVEFKVNLLAPAAGESFVVRSAVKRAGKTLTIVTADAFALKENGANEKEKPIATMLATMINRPE